MVAKVVPIAEDVLLPDETAADVVDLLRKLLSEAEAGEITGVALVCVGPAQQPVPNWAYKGRGTGFVLAGAVSRLLWCMNQSQE